MYAGRLTFLLAALLAALLQTGDSACLTSWISYKGNCYSFGHEKVTWFEGLEFCIANGGKLLEIRSNRENEWIVNEIKTRKMGEVWLGSTDVLNIGEWNWLTDRKDVGAVADWAVDQPDNNSGLEHCLEISARYGYKWNDSYCKGRNNIVCKARDLPN